MNLKKWTLDHTKGLFLGIITPLVIAPLVLYIMSIVQDYYFDQLWLKFTINKPYQIKIITMSIIANLGLFLSQ